MISLQKRFLAMGYDNYILCNSTEDFLHDGQVGKFFPRLGISVLVSIRDGYTAIAYHDHKAYRKMTKEQKATAVKKVKKEVKNLLKKVH